MLLFGTRTRNALLATLTLLCGRCGNPSAHQLLRRTTMFTLFFVPLFPVRRARVTALCTFCGLTSEVPKEQVEGLQQQAAEQAAAYDQPPAPAVPPAPPAPPATEMPGSGREG